MIWLAQVTLKDGKGDGRLDAADGIAAGALPEGDSFHLFPE